MPRVKTATRKRAVLKHPMRCSACGNEVAVGQQYYGWERRHGGKQFRHVACGYPRPTQLSGRKTAQIEEAILDADLSLWRPEIPADWDGNVENIDVDVEYLRDLMSPVADTARDVASEYESGADNMPESLQYGSQAEAMREVAQELETWVDEIESFEPNLDVPDWPEREEDEEGNEEPLDEFRTKVEDALSSWVDDVRGEAEDKFSDMPEYQG